MGQSTRRPQRNYRTQVVPAQAGPTVPDSGHAELGYQFVNYLHRPVTVLNRSGMRVIIPHRLNHRQAPKVGKKPNALDHVPRFIVRSKVITGGDVILDTTELSNDMGHATSVESQALLDSIQISEDKLVRNQRTEVWVEYHIPAEDFDAQGGVLFLQNLDLQVSILDQASTAPHPFSVLGQRNRDAFEFKETLTPKGVIYGVYIRDRDRQHGPRFVNINGVVYGVPVIDDEEDATDGVYCITTGRTNSNFVTRRTLTEFFTFEEADEKLGLYGSYRDAYALGNPQEKFKRETDERRQKLTLDELAFREERSAAERLAEQARDKMRRAMMEYDHERSRIDQLNKIISAELDRREQHFRRELMILKELTEVTGHERKEAMEILKLIPTVITTAATYVAMYKKLKSM